MDDQLNVPLEDAELLAEVELTTNLIIAASEADASCRRPRSTGCSVVESPSTTRRSLQQAARTA